jgi:hypothetical protein
MYRKAKLRNDQMTGYDLISHKRILVGEGMTPIEWMSFRFGGHFTTDERKSRIHTYTNSIVYIIRWEAGVKSPDRETGPV